jgi:hypothetical protein
MFISIRLEKSQCSELESLPLAYVLIPFDFTPLNQLMTLGNVAIEIRPMDKQMVLRKR